MTRASVAILAIALLEIGCASNVRRVSGVYTWGHEVETFSPCGGEKAWWVVADEQLLTLLRSEHQRLTSEPYQGIYVEVSGTFLDTPQDEGGFAAQYEGLFEISSITRVAGRTDSAAAGCMSDGVRSGRAR